MGNTLFEFDKVLRLPESLRAELQRVHGRLLRECELSKVLKTENGILISVGDVVTYTLLKHGFSPKVAVVDYKTKRENIELEEIKNFGDIVYCVRNPPGTITPEFAKRIKDAINHDGNVRLEVDGEEDLGVIPAVIYAPVGGIVIYGMPDTGLVLLKVTDDDKKSALEIVRNMEV